MEILSYANFTSKYCKILNIKIENLFGKLCNHKHIYCYFSSICNFVNSFHTLLYEFRCSCYI